MAGKRKPLDAGQKGMNSIMTNFNKFVKEEPEKYDAAMLSFVMSRIHQKQGQTLRYLMCRCLKTGLMTDPAYKEDFLQFCEEFKSASQIV